MPAIERASQGDLHMTITTINIEEIFALDRQQPPTDRSLPWKETRNGVTVVVEPKPHWAIDLLAFVMSARSYCYYADWCHNGVNARFSPHISTAAPTSCSRLAISSRKKSSMAFGADPTRSASQNDLPPVYRAGQWRRQRSGFRQFRSCGPPGCSHHPRL
jgi:hypothetical protein